MTYNVLMGTLNPTHSLTLYAVLICQLLPVTILSHSIGYISLTFNVCIMHTSRYNSKSFSSSVQLIFEFCFGDTVSVCLPDCKGKEKSIPHGALEDCSSPFLWPKNT